MKETNKRIKYIEIVYLRSIITILIIAGHSFAVYSGAWIKPEWLDISSTQKFYQFINPFLVYAALPSFVLISGYLSNKYNINCTQTLKLFIIKKFKRLIIPSVLYGIIYTLLFNSTFSNISIAKFIYNILCGVGHLWFLPMLFSIIIFDVIFYKKIYLNLALSCSILFLISFTPMPFRFSEMLWYYPFFVIGKYFFKQRNKFKSIIILSKIKIIDLLLIYTTCFIFFEVIHNAYTLENIIILNVKLQLIIISLLKFGLGLVGSVCLLLISFILKHKITYFSKLSLFINNHSFNIYIYHQFIILVFMYKLKLNSNENLLPIIIFIVSITISLILSVLSTIITSRVKSSIGNQYYALRSK